MALYRKGTSISSELSLRHLLKHFRINKIPIVSIQHSSSSLILQDDTQSDAKKQFIPITRKTLIRKLMENEHLVSKTDHEKFFDFSVGLESSISKEFHSILMELKQLYDPLNPDKETLRVYHVGPKQRREQEFWLLQKLSDLLDRAHFQELTREEIRRALAEHSAHEGVMVHVDLNKFEVIRIWTLGDEDKPLEHNSLREWVKNKTLVATNRWPKTIPTYKRVVVAIRHKNQNKLFLKAFKDVPKNSLEYILPEGKISISKYDKGLIATTVAIGGISLTTRMLSSVADLNISWTSIVAGATGLLALNSWNAYKNKRNKYLVNLAKSFYYKTLANNRALLTLVVDRSEDEVFKAAVLAYTFIRMENIARGVDSDQNSFGELYLDRMVTVNELNLSIESWMKSRHNVDIVFDAKTALRHLEHSGLLKSQKLGKEVHVETVSLDKALRVLPSATVLSLSERDEELDVEDIEPQTDNEKAAYMEKKEQKLAESNARGWE